MVERFLERDDGSVIARNFLHEEAPAVYVGVSAIYEAICYHDG